MLPVTDKEKELFHQLAKVKQNSKTQVGWLNVLGIKTDKFSELLVELKVKNKTLPASNRCVIHIHDYEYYAKDATGVSLIYDEMICWPSQYTWTIFIRWEDVESVLEEAARRKYGKKWNQHQKYKKDHLSGDNYVTCNQ